MIDTLGGTLNGHPGESLSLCSLITTRVAMRFGQLRLALILIAADRRAH